MTHPRRFAVPRLRGFQRYRHPRRPAEAGTTNYLGTRRGGIGHITVNIPMLPKFSKGRTVLLSEQGYHSRDNSPEAQTLQAAAIVYAWRQMAGLKSIEAFHYHRWIDHEREGGLKLGLWTVKKGSTTWPEAKKQSWVIYRALGTPDEDGATQFSDEFLDPG